MTSFETADGGNSVIYNTLMKRVLQCVQYDNIPAITVYPIWQMISYNGEPFWGVGNFCGLLDTEIGSQYDLIALEWNGNEICITQSSDVSDLVVYALGIVKAWKIHMENYERATPFDILLSVDYGDKDVSPSATLRFWAVRNQAHYVKPSFNELENVGQPVLMEQVNYSI